MLTVMFFDVELTIKSVVVCAPKSWSCCKCGSLKSSLCYESLMSPVEPNLYSLPVGPGKTIFEDSL